MIFYNNLNMHNTYVNLIRCNLWNDVSIVKKSLIYMYVYFFKLKKN